ncbi:DNA/RNA nuclease SfsA [Methylobacterium persicinum]|uniref:Sugar fermentation stimulation protein homolog n=1 Tax=Methylobacterium persicinum TaxID=374426 RepID=A0ABU0HP54_9HYPH|nr:DNA/RNA nuclease SfsA [Methylobacterium persicinum]MDQ0444108.1 sugar fermentation stimulation protein A [Methylobacterium persicinum]GJE38344.1 Sugar fermentation stimulation protein A [Methylobacterium persicinum]
MLWPSPLSEGRLLRRYKRFLADIETPAGVETVHCPNPGAMMGLLAPGSRVLMSHSANPARKLPLTWELVEADLPSGPQWVGINTVRPNGLVAEAFRAGLIAPLAGYEALRPEVRYAKASRVDFVASGPAGPCHVEVKNCHLMRRAGLAEFPDCTAARSARHMRDLADVVAAGGRALVVIVVQMQAGAFDVARDIDPAFDRAFRDARAAGVETRAYRCDVGPAGVTIAGEIPIVTPE